MTRLWLLALVVLPLGAASVVPTAGGAGVGSNWAARAVGR